MNGWDIILILLIGAAFLLAVRKVRKDMKSGSSCLSCGGSCAGCSDCSAGVAGRADKTAGAAGCISGTAGAAGRMSEVSKKVRL